jgi:hypothetical protein
MLWSLELYAQVNGFMIFDMVTLLICLLTYAETSDDEQGFFSGLRDIHTPDI